MHIYTLWRQHKQLKVVKSKRFAENSHGLYFTASCCCDLKRLFNLSHQFLKNFYSISSFAWRISLLLWALQPSLLVGSGTYAAVALWCIAAPNWRMADDDPVLTPLRDMFKMCHQIFYIVNGIFACALLRMVFVWSFVAQHRFGGFLLDKHFYLKSIFTCLSMMQCEVAVLRIYAYFNECSQLYSFAFIAERDMFYTIQSFFFF